MFPRTARVAGFLLITAFILFLSIQVPKPALAKEQRWLNEVSGGRISVLYSREIPTAEANRFREEIGRAMDFLDQNYPLPYPAITRARLLLVTRWNDYSFGASFKHRGLLRMYVSPPSLYVADCYESVLSFMGSRFLIPGMAQFLADRYRGEDSMLRTALFLKAQQRVSLNGLFDREGASGGRPGVFYSASFLSFLVDRFGWSRVIEFAAAPKAVDDLNRSLEDTFGVSARRLESDWNSSLLAAGLRNPPFNARQFLHQSARFDRLIAMEARLSAAYNRGELATARTMAGYLLKTPVETPAIEEANDRFERAILKARLVNSTVLWGPILLVLLHVIPIVIRRRRRLAKFRLETGRLKSGHRDVAHGKNSPGLFVTSRQR